MGHLYATAEPHRPFGLRPGLPGWPVGPAAMVAAGPVMPTT